MNSVSLQINSLAALERLIGGDAQLEADLRQSVAAAFADKYLKAIAKDDKFASLAAGMAAAIQKAATERIDSQFAVVKRDWRGQIDSVTFSKDVQDELQNKARRSVEKAINDAVAAAVAKIESGTTIDEIVKRAIDSRIQHTIETKVRARLSEIAAKL